MRTEAFAGRAGKQKDGSANTREAKLGCVFIQTIPDEKGRPLRDPASTCRGCRETAVLQRQEVVRRGSRNNFELTFPGAVQILDYCHASEYPVEIADAIHSDDQEKAKALHTRWLWAKKRPGL